jgi:hypothetical protein
VLDLEKRAPLAPSEATVEVCNVQDEPGPTRVDCLHDSRTPSPKAPTPRWATRLAKPPSPRWWRQQGSVRFVGWRKHRSTSSTRLAPDRGADHGDTVQREQFGLGDRVRHAGIVNIVRQAKRLAAVDQIFLVT